MYEQLKTLINQYIKTNGSRQITGQVLNNVLNEMVNSLGGASGYGGIITPTSQTPANDANIFYIAIQQGNYTAFGITVNAHELAFVKRSGNGWAKDAVPLGSGIVANPHGEATEQLSKIEIDGTVYQNPQGPAGQNGVDAVNPFKGWFTTDNIPTTGQAGDYCNVSDTSVTPHTVTIYRWNTTTNQFEDTGEVPDTATGETFANGETLQQVAIDDSHLANPVNTADATKPVLARAEDVMQLKVKLEGVTMEEVKDTSTDVFNKYIKNGVPSTPGGNVSSYAYRVIDVSNCKSVRFYGVEFSSTSTSTYGYAWYDSTNDGTQTDGTGLIGNGIQFDKGIGSLRLKEYELLVPSGAKWLFVTSHTVDLTDFYCYKLKGESVNGNADNIPMFPDEKNGYIGGSDGTHYRTTDPIGIKRLALKKGQIVLYHVEKITTQTTIYGILVESNGTSKVIDVVNPNSTTNNCVGVFKAESDCIISFSFNYELNNWYRIVEDFKLENANGHYLYPWNKWGTNSISWQGAINTFGTNAIQFTNSASYICVFWRIPENLSNKNNLFFKCYNNSYKISRLWGVKNYVFVNNARVNIEYTDIFGNVCVAVHTSVNNGSNDTICMFFQKQDGYTDEEYAAFKIENPFADLKQFDETVNVPLLYDNTYYQVGSVVNWRRQGYYRVVKDKPANSWGDSDCFKKISLIDTTNIPIEDSNAEIAAVMNTISANIGATNSNWKNTYGGKLYNVNHCYNRTTAKDMVRFMVAATKYPAIIEIMGTENATVHIYGEHDRNKTLKNGVFDKLADAYESIHGVGATMPYKILCAKPGATVASDGTDSHGNQSWATGNDDVSNTGFAIVGIAEINGKMVAFDAANVSKTGYAAGRTARAKATIELLDECKYILDNEGQSSSPTYTYLERGAAAVMKETPYLNLNQQTSIEFLLTYNGDTQYQPASTSKLVGGLAMLSVLSNLEEYHSIWNDTKELINDSGDNPTDPECHVAYGGDVESVKTSLYCMFMVSNGANTLSLGRLAGEKIVKSKSMFLPEVE